MKKSKIFLLLFLSVILISCKKEVLLESISIKENSMQTEFFRGDIYNFDNTILILEYSDDSKKEIKANTQGVEITGFDTATEGKKEVVFTYEEKQVKQEITVNEIVVTSIEIKKGTLKVEFYTQDSYDFCNTVLIIKYNNDSEKEIKASDQGVEITGFDTATEGKKEVVFTYGEKQVKQEISVKKLKVTKLEISEYFSKEYIKDTDQIRVNTNKVVLNYNNGKTEIIDLTNENIEVLNFDNTNLGIITVAIYLKLIIIKKPINNFLLIG